MSDTLVERLEKLDHYFEYTAQFSAPIPSMQQDTYKAQILDQFYKENPLAGRVAAGETSYAEQTRPVAEYLGSWWSLMRKPRLNPELDEQIKQTLTSLNEVGKQELEIDFYITAQRRREMFAFEKSFTLVIGAFAAILYNCHYYSTSAPSSILEPLAVAGGIVIGGPACVRALSARLDERMILLEEACRETDTYLQSLKK